MGLDVTLAKYFGKDNLNSRELKEKLERDLDSNSLVERISISSKKYPSHLFKIGYFRSSYNSQGINNILSMLGLATLYEIFEVRGEDYIIFPNWEDSKKKVNNCRKQLEELTSAFPFSLTTLPITFEENLTPDVVFDEFKKRLESFRRKEPSLTRMTSYLTRRGFFHFDNRPLKVRSIQFGKTMGMETCFVIFQVDPKEYKWYVQALEIVEETIDYVLERDKKKFFLLWSA